MALCKLCGRKAEKIYREIGVCLSCIRRTTVEALALADAAHGRSRKEFGLPVTPPDDPAGEACRRCANRCRMPEGGLGYCGIRLNRDFLGMIRYIGVGEIKKNE